mmetsp:Transcript_24787/g.71333  ORF Transcript_24787/g.71333 Transcript_24787/m.71333 type:complete len:200 (+) Transcript_24787:65-664(+)
MAAFSRSACSVNHPSRPQSSCTSRLWVHGLLRFFPHCFRERLSEFHKFIACLLHAVRGRVDEVLGGPVQGIRDRGDGLVDAIDEVLEGVELHLGLSGPGLGLLRQLPVRAGRLLLADTEQARWHGTIGLLGRLQNIGEGVGELNNLLASLFHAVGGRVHKLLGASVQSVSDGVDGIVHAINEVLEGVEFCPGCVCFALG